MPFPYMAHALTQNGNPPPCHSKSSQHANMHGMCMACLAWQTLCILWKSMPFTSCQSYHSFFFSWIPTHTSMHFMPSCHAMPYYMLLVSCHAIWHAINMLLESCHAILHATGIILHASGIMPCHLGCCSHHARYYQHAIRIMPCHSSSSKYNQKYNELDLLVPDAGYILMPCSNSHTSPISHRILDQLLASMFCTRSSIIPYMYLGMVLTRVQLWILWAVAFCMQCLILHDALGMSPYVIQPNTTKMAVNPFAAPCHSLFYCQYPPIFPCTSCHHAIMPCHAPTTHPNLIKNTRIQ